jgi:hypothetical protein
MQDPPPSTPSPTQVIPGRAGLAIGSDRSYLRQLGGLVDWPDEGPDLAQRAQAAPSAGQGCSAANAPEQQPERDEELQRRPHGYGAHRPAVWRPIGA